MHFPRFVRILNGILAVLAVLVAIFLFLKVYRPLPQVTGELSAPLHASAEIRRDSRGIPHIKAAGWEDAVFLEGFAMAQDRLFQMDGMRRLAAGELSEVAGKSTLESDLEARRLRMRRMAEAHARTLPPADRAVLAAFARGVNYYIETNRSRLPVEFTLLGYQPRPWTIADTLLAGLQMYRNLTTTWKHELQKMSLLEKGDRAKVEYLYPPRTGLEVQPGSNAWAISGAHTASGKPLLASDPHLDFGLPSTWYLVHLEAPDLNVEGATLPGVPCVIIGHNANIAWGVTNLGFDVQDLYEEKLTPGGFLFNGKPSPTTIEREIILVKGEKPVAQDLLVTQHGPVIHTEGNRLFALRWVAGEPGSFQFPFLQVDQAKNWTEFRAALKRYPGPAQNFVYADREGNIAYQATGLLPIRRKYTGDVPVDGSTGEFEWQGFIPFDELPSHYNPPAGYVITANQNPFPPDYPYTVHGDFSPHYRSNQIRDLLVSHEKWVPAQLIAIQKDVYSPFSDFLAKQMVAAFDRAKPTNPAFPAAIDLLRKWNGQIEKASAPPMVVTLLYQHVRKAIVNVAAPGKADLYQDEMSQSVVERLMRQRPAGWFKDYDQMLIKALDGAMIEGRELQGSDPKAWDYGRYNQLHLLHPVLGHVGDHLPILGEWLNSVVGAYSNIGPLPMSGSATTVKQTTRHLGPSMRFVADLSNWDQSLMGLTIGESGQVGSSHYRDEFEPYYIPRGLPFSFDHVDVEDILRIVAK